MQILKIWLDKRKVTMTNRELLREIYKESKAINRNIQRVANVGLLGIFERVAKEAEKNDDEDGKFIVKVAGI